MRRREILRWRRLIAEARDVSGQVLVDKTPRPDRIRLRRLAKSALRNADELERFLRHHLKTSKHHGATP